MTTPLDLSLLGVPRTANGLIEPTEVQFYYLHDSDGRLAACVCFGVSPLSPVGNTFCRGIALCSKHDNFNKKLSRELAYRRFLMVAPGNPLLGAGLVRRGWALVLLKQAGIWHGYACHDLYKAEYDAKLSKAESRIWRKRCEIKGLMARPGKPTPKRKSAKRRVA